MQFSTLCALGAVSLLSIASAGKVSYSMTHNDVEVPVTVKELPWMDRQLKLNTTAAPNGPTARSGPVSTTSNWAGTIWNSAPSGSYGTITAKWNVPGIYPPPGSPASVPGGKTYFLVEWVGIGSDCGHIIQAGTGQILTSSGLQQIVWWEWFPDNAITTINMPSRHK